MKKNKSKTNGAKLITIEFDNAVAQTVNIAGSFNDWRPEATDMIPLGNGRWRKQLTLAPGIYEYLFVADGRWIPDPSATESVRNPFGGVNSVLKI
jgi:hypothetical protein